MILFYSEYCDHCKVLLDTIKRHDTNKLIKLVSIEYLNSIKKKIDKIHSVPALIFPNTKEIIYGKAVFDHLLLPNRGVLFTKTSTRTIEKENPINVKKDDIIDEPSAFKLGSISSDNFSSIEENEIDNNDKIYNWTSLDIKYENKNYENKYTDDKNKKLPTLEEIMKSREMQ